MKNGRHPVFGRFLGTAALLLAALLGFGVGGIFQVRRSEPVGGPSKPPPPLARTQKVDTWQARLATARTTAPSRAEESWVLWADAVPKGEIPAAVAALDGSRDFIALRVLLARWARFDPLAAVAAWRAKSLPSSHSISMEMEEGRGPNSSSFLSTRPRGEAGGALLRGWSSVQPREAAEFAAAAKARRDPDFQDWDLEAVMSAGGNGPSRETSRLAEQAKTDPRGAGEAALALPSVERRTMAARSVLAEWMASDPAAAEAWYRTWPDETKIALGAENFDYPMSRAPADVRARLWSERIPLAFDAEALRPTGIGSWLSRGDPVTQTASALGEWAGRDYSAAKRWVESQESSAVHGFLTGHLAGALVSGDRTSEAISLVDTLADDDKPAALFGMAHAWSRVDAAAAADWAGRIEDALCRDACLAAIAEGVGASNPDWAMAAAEKISDPGQRGALRDRILHGARWSGALSRRLGGRQ